MPRFDNVDDMMQLNTSAGTFQFSAVKPENLGASEYTVVCLIIDCSGSLYDFIQKLNDAVKTVIGACMKSPRSDNLLFRVITFNSSVDEVHGFKELHQIDINDYPQFGAYGMTALYDAVLNGIGSVIDLAETLIQQDFSVNGAAYIMTDGLDNCSTYNVGMIKELMDEAVKGEKIESMAPVLIAMKDPNMTGADWADKVSKQLEDFTKEAGIPQFVDIGEITEGKLAKLAEFVSQSISSQSQGLGTGAPSKPINITF